MTRRTAARRAPDRETSGAVDFDAALEGYIQGGNPEELLQAAGKIIDCHLRIDPEHADAISELTDNLDIEIETYADAAHAIRRWFATMWEPGARH
jgi:hypothetical protein